ncbi:prenyltransferase/squalene oxidase repeat-containing protein [Sorangium sp. So ce1128]
MNTHPQPRSERALDGLRRLITDIGQGGGLVSPSVYDTAVALMFDSFPYARESIIAWLLEQQRSDGGWGLSSVPRARDLPTVAAIVALHPYRDAVPRVRRACEGALEFLRNQAEHWGTSLPDDIPVGLELLMPRLLDEASSMGLDVDSGPYRALFALGERRRALIGKARPAAGSAAAHSWEGWGSGCSRELIDASGGVGHSPAATAAWLYTSRDQAGLADARAAAHDYLLQASKSTQVGIPGVVPTVWPINRFEQAWVLYSLRVLGLLDHPGLGDVVRPQLLDLDAALRPEGMGMSDAFTHDGDITSTAIATLGKLGTPHAIGTLRRFERDGMFITYANELQPSLTTNAHAIHALACHGEDASKPARYLLERQRPDGRWVGDKWHSSWIYATTQVILALLHEGQMSAVKAGTEALLRAQREDGGWGAGCVSTAAETAYAVLAICAVQRDREHESMTRAAWRRGYSWLVANDHIDGDQENLRWIGKELYCPVRVDRAWILGSLLVPPPS